MVQELIPSPRDPLESDSITELVKNLDYFLDNGAQEISDPLVFMTDLFEHLKFFADKDFNSEEVQNSRGRTFDEQGQRTAFQAFSNQLDSLGCQIGLFKDLFADENNLHRLINSVVAWIRDFKRQNGC